MNLRNRAVTVVAAVTIGAGGVLAMGATAEAAVRPVSAHAPSAKASQTYRVVGVRKGRELAVQAAADPKSRIVGHLGAGATTTGTGRSSHGYLEVRLGGGRTGWVPGKNLQRIDVKRR
ncbi:hypothetical protein [Actinoallomurus soli]|uniref:hypothetical protein n=1 Tax=Actinoallomurus soli TaxID=2952535 RepID=UPI002092D996|nr:hypothetical protein [Actinoallomurus soli]MCO5970536.1 hypothetical protein [Actinoallomurus soli]